MFFFGFAFTRLYSSFSVKAATALAITNQREIAFKKIVGINTNNYVLACVRFRTPDARNLGITFFWLLGLIDLLR